MAYTYEQYLADQAALTGAQQPQQAIPTQNTSTFQDYGTSIKKGLELVPSALTGLGDAAYNLVGGKRIMDAVTGYDTDPNPLGVMSDVAGRSTGFQPAKWADEATAEYTPWKQAQAQRASEIYKSGTLADAGRFLSENPEYTGNMILESIPSMVAGGAIGRGVKALTGIKSAVTAAGIGEGAIMTGQSYNEMIQNGVDPETAARYATGVGVLGGGIGMAGGRVARAIGLEDVEATLAGGSARAGATTRGLENRAVRGLVGGGIEAGEEGLQSSVEAAAGNLATGQDITQGMGGQAGLGMAAGFGMGGGFNLLGDSPSTISKQNADREAAQDAYKAARGKQWDQFADVENAVARGDASYAGTGGMFDQTVVNPPTVQGADSTIDIVDGAPPLASSIPVAGPDTEEDAAPDAAELGAAMAEGEQEQAQEQPPEVKRATSFDDIDNLSPLQKEAVKERLLAWAEAESLNPAQIDLVMDSTKRQQDPALAQRVFDIASKTQNSDNQWLLELPSQVAGDVVDARGQSADLQANKLAEGRADELANSLLTEDERAIIATNKNGQALSSVTAKLNKLKDAFERAILWSDIADKNARATPFLEGEDINARGAAGEVDANGAPIAAKMRDTTGLLKNINALKSALDKISQGVGINPSKVIENNNQLANILRRELGVKSLGSASVKAQIPTLLAERGQAILAELESKIVRPDPKSDAGAAKLMHRSTKLNTTTQAQTNATKAFNEIVEMLGNDDNAIATVDNIIGKMKKVAIGDKASLDETLSEDEAIDGSEEGSYKKLSDIKRQSQIDTRLSRAWLAHRSNRTGGMRASEMRESSEAGKAYKRFDSLYQAMDYIRSHGANVMERGLASLVRRAIGDKDIKFIYDKEPPKGWGEFEQAKYVVSPKGEVTIYARTAKPEVLMHEAIHAVTSRWLVAHPKHGSVLRLVRALDAVDAAMKKAMAVDAVPDGLNLTPNQWKVVQAVWSTISKARSGANGDMKAINELLAYGLTNHEFGQMLKTVGLEFSDAEMAQRGADLTAIRTGVKGQMYKLWTALKEFFKSVFGVDKLGKATVLEAIIDEGMLAIEAQSAAPESELASKFDQSYAAAATAPSAQQGPYSFQDMSTRSGGIVDFIMEKLFYIPREFVLKPIEKAVTEAYSGFLKAHPGAAYWLSNFVDNAGLDVFFPKVTESLNTYKATRNGASYIGNKIEDALRNLDPVHAQVFWNEVQNPTGTTNLPTQLSELAKETHDALNNMISTAQGLELFDSTLRNAKIADVIQYISDKEGIATGGFSAVKFKRTKVGRVEKSAESDAVNWGNAPEDADVASLKSKNYYAILTIDGKFDTMVAEDALDVTMDKDPLPYQLKGFTTDSKTGMKNANFVRTATLAEVNKAADGGMLANYLANTMAAFSKSISAAQLIKDLNVLNTAQDADKFIFDDVAAAQTAGLHVLGKMVDNKSGKATFTPLHWSGWEGTNLHLKQREEARRPDRWVLLKGKSWGALDGKVVNGSIVASLADMHTNERIPFRSYNGLMRYWKISKTAFSIPTHVTNIMSSFVLAYMHDIPVSQIIKSAKIMAKMAARGTRFENKFGAVTEQEKAIWAAFEASGALLGNFSSNELHGRIAESLAHDMDDRNNSYIKLVTKLLDHEKVKSTWSALVAVKDGAMKLYEAEDNAFRFAAFMTELHRIETNRTDGRVGFSDADYKSAGKFAKTSMIDYEINARAVNVARQTALPFLAWPYRAIPMLTRLAVQKPHKMATVMAVLWGISSLGFAVSGDGGGGGDDEESVYNKLPKWMRNRVFGFGPRAYVRMPFLGTDEDPVFWGIGKWVPGGDLIASSEDGFMGIPGFPSFLTPTGPFVAIIAAGFGWDTFRGQSLHKDTNSATENAYASVKYLADQLSPGIISSGVKTASDLYDPSLGVLGNPMNHAYALSRFFGSRLYQKNMSEEEVKRYREADYLQREFKAEMARVAREEGRKESPDWERLRENQDKRLAVMYEKLKEITGEDYGA